MSLSEKLEEVLAIVESLRGKSLTYTSTPGVSYAFSRHADELSALLPELREMARKAAAFDAAPVETMHHLGGGHLAAELVLPEVWSAIDGQRVRLVIEDAAMGRREGEVRTFKVCRCHTADARRLCPDKRECMTAEAHATTPEDADDAR